MPTWSILFPDECRLIKKAYFKEAGIYTFSAPPAGFVVPGTAGVELPASAKLFIRTGACGVGAQGEFYGSNGAFSRSKRPCVPGETFQIQVGRTSQASSAGDSWLRRTSGEMLCYADRGRGSAGHGDAAYGIGDVRRSGTSAGSPSDADLVAPLGFGGRPGYPGSGRAPGPGGAGHLWPAYPDTSNTYHAGQGMVAVEVYWGDPGVGY